MINKKFQIDYTTFHFSCHLICGFTFTLLVPFNDEIKSLVEVLAVLNLPGEISKGSFLGETIGPAFRKDFGRTLRFVGDEFRIVWEDFI